MPRAGPPAVPDDPAEARRAAYAAALGWLAGREMSAARVRERLLRRGFPAGIADDALARLAGAGAIDDRRAALAAARTLVGVRQRGRHRVGRELERLGFGREEAASALESALAEVDEQAVIDRLVRARLRGRQALDDAADYRRVFSALLRRGFPADRIRTALRPYWGHRATEPDDA